MGADSARFKGIGAKGDRTLRSKTVGIAGLGAVGTTAAAGFTREHIGLRLVDMGRVEEEDMHRMSIFYEEDITKFKVKQAKARLNAINPTVPIKSFHEELSESNVFLLNADVIVDATNSGESNAIVLDYALKAKIPVIVTRYSGSKAVILVLHRKPAPGVLKKLIMPGINKEGIFGPITTTAASIIVAQCMRILLGKKENLLIELDTWDLKAKVSKA